ncbi:MAG TPA: hypothetical protein VHM19_22215, partial [Polyangiales bacterium]|nr:hypothetical protein [Polyangiales bacterium]
MAPLVLAYWVLCCFPGHALAKRAGWIEPEHSLLSRIALSYLALFAVVAVLAGAAYLGHLPLWTLGTVMVLLIVLGVADSLAAIWRSRASFRLSALDPVAVIGWSVLLADLWLGIVRGGHLGGDAAFHISRVRMLVDHGFNNWDPYIDGPFFSRVYHTNVYHALLAVAAQLARVEPIDAWLWTLPFAKLVVAAGTFHVAWTVLRQRALAWFATIYMIVQIAPLAYLLYPNKLSGFWLFPMVVSAMVALWEEERPPLTAASVLAAGVLVLAHVHPLYAVFACLTVAPIFGLRWLWRLSRRGPTRAPLFAMLALLFCMPALLVTKLAPTVPADTKVQPPPAVTLDAGAQAVLHQRSKAVQPGAQKGFAYYGKHGFALDPARYLKPVAWVPFAALLLGLFSTRRRAFMALGSV